MKTEERTPAAYRDLAFVMPMSTPRMAQSITCLHCPQSFAGKGMWNAYARHLKREHCGDPPLRRARAAGRWVRV